MAIAALSPQIQTIIQTKITKGYVFDAHSIIDYLIQNHSDLYLSSYPQGLITAQYHSEISKTIASFERNLITRIGDCWSQNIHAKYTPNVCWQKL